MDSGYYAAFTGLMARMQALDSAANNLANTQTNGFRAEKDYFRNTITGPDASDSQLNTAINNFGVLGGNRVDLSQGQLQHTGNPLDVAIEGSGFFQTQRADGTIVYTRDGSFLRSTKGILVNGQGQPILNTKNKPITIPTGAVTIADDGTVSVAGAVVGQIGIVNFPAGTPLVPDGTSQYTAPAKAAKLNTKASLHQGMLESSNQDVVHGTLQLILVQRQAEMMQKALSVFGNDLDQQASQSLPRV
ncbi:MAG TPA: flagellar hook-basal body protein [Acidobacteriaceae bacterium]|nr:flagellar hook-basal body protein [Acidobacteriaceae bacterium]